MKSLRVFVCILVATFTLFGGFTTPEKVSAAVTEQDYLTLKSRGADFDNQFNLGNHFIYRLSFSLPSSEYESILSKQYTTAKDNPSITKRKLEADVLSIFLSYIDDQIKTYSAGGAVCIIGSCDQEVSAYKAVRINAQQLFDNANSAVQQEMGTITAAQHLENVKNAAGTAGQQYTNRQNSLGEKCDIFNIGACINDGLTWLIKNTLLQIAGFLVWLSANMFNYSVQIGILNFSDWAPDALYDVWMIVRQIISLLIVFAGLYLGFLYIVGDPQGRFEKYLPWVVMFALFVNFSYPLARTAIDISNIISLKIYTSAVGNEALVADPKNVVPIFTSNESAGALIMSKLGLQGLIGSAVSNEKTGSMIGDVTSIPGALMAVIFTFYTAYIFFMVTGIMAVRTAALVFLTIASPILFIDSVIPVLGEKAKMLRKIFFEQLAVGPVFMIMLALTLKFLDVFNKGLTSVGALNTQGGSADTIVTFFNILMMLIMLKIMIKVTKHIAGTAGEYATNAMGTVGGFALGAAGGGAGILARKGIGGLALKAKQSNWVQENQNTLRGRVAMQLSNSLANSSFDVRNTSVAGRMNKLGMGMGMGTKLGFEGVSEEKSRKIAETSKGIKVRHSRDVYEVGADGQKRLVHKEGDVDHIATAAAKRRFAENLGGSSSIFQTKEQKRMIEEKLKSGKGEEMNAMVEEYKKFENTAEGRAKKKEFFDKQSKEIQERLTRHDREVANEILSEYRELDETAEGRARKQEFFDKQGKEIQEKLTRYDQEVKEKKDKEASDQKYREDTLQVQKEQNEISKKQAELQQQHIDLLTRQNAPGTQGVSSTAQPNVVAGATPAKSEVDFSKVTLETNEKAAERTAPFEPSLESDAQIAKRLEDVDAINDNVLEMSKRVINKASKVEEPPVTI